MWHMMKTLGFVTQLSHLLFDQRAEQRREGTFYSTSVHGKIKNCNIITWNARRRLMDASFLFCRAAQFKFKWWIERCVHLSFLPPIFYHQIGRVHSLLAFTHVWCVHSYFSQPLALTPWKIKCLWELQSRWYKVEPGLTRGDAAVTIKITPFDSHMLWKYETQVPYHDWLLLFKQTNNNQNACSFCENKNLNFQFIYFSFTYPKNTNHVQSFEKSQ